MTLAAHPDIVGRYLVADRPVFYAVKRDELDRSGHAYARVVGTFRTSPGSYVLTVSLTQEVVQFAPFEEACTLLGMIGANADASPYDAARVESLIRQFDIPLICGVDANVLDGLAMFGLDAARIFAGRVVWARPNAYDRVAALPGVTARLCAEIGPALGLECAAGEGLHVDGREWALEAVNGEIRISSRMARIEPVRDLDTKLPGRVEWSPCRCGCPEPRVFLASPVN